MPKRPEPIEVNAHIPVEQRLGPLEMIDRIPDRAGAAQPDAVNVDLPRPVAAPEPLDVPAMPAVQQPAALDVPPIPAVRQPEQVEVAGPREIAQPLPLDLPPIAPMQAPARDPLWAFPPFPPNTSFYPDPKIVWYDGPLAPSTHWMS